MDKDLDHSVEDGNSPIAGEKSTGDGSTNGASRRRFTRNAVVGSAVFLTLGNRAAWGGSSGGGEPVDCMSTALLLSYRMADGNFQSAHPQEQERKDQAEAIESLIKQKNKYYTDTVGNETCVYEKK